MTTIGELMETVNPSRIVNCDETFWLLHPRSILTCVDMGCQTVHARITGDEKDRITVVASVTASGEKLSLALIAPGKTRRVEDS
jgi:predicted transposase YbfD/YdcC